MTVIAVGTCTLRASQAGNASYFKRHPTSIGAFTVTAAAQTIDFSPSSAAPSDLPPFELLRRIDVGIARHLRFANARRLPCERPLADELTVGTCTIRASQAGNGNYAAAPKVDRSFAVTPAFQTLLFPQPTAQSLLHPQFQPQATASSGLPVTFSSLTPTDLYNQRHCRDLVAAGTCTLRATQAGNANFAAVSIDRTFTVTSSSVANPKRRDTRTFHRISHAAGWLCGEWLWSRQGVRRRRRTRRQRLRRRLGRRFIFSGHQFCNVQ